jgi:hypothetical protein
MRIFLYPFMALAALGLLLSLLVHIAALAGLPVPGAAMVLYVAIFVVWIPACFIANRRTQDVPQRDFWKATLRNCPRWMKRIVYALALYTIVNLTIFTVRTIARPQPKGNIQPAVLRSLSGHWMAFYAAAFAFLYSQLKAGRPERVRQCPAGHLLAESDDLCPFCGAAPVDDLPETNRDDDLSDFPQPSEPLFEDATTSPDDGGRVASLRHAPAATGGVQGRDLP